MSGNIKVVILAFVIATIVTFFSINPGTLNKGMNNKYANEVKEILTMNYFKKQIKIIDNLPVD